jgi:hypothetical protein
VLVNPRLTAAQNLRDAAREQARTNPGVPVNHPAAPGHYRPKTIEDLTQEAEVVLLATLSQTNSYLTPNADRILTDYSIHVERVIAGSLPARQTQTPGAIVVPLVLVVFGGDVTVDGVLIRSRDDSLEAYQDGGRYLLFLMKARPRREPGRYEMYYGGVFEIVQEKAKPLLKEAKRVFGDVTGAPLNELIPRIENAAPRR